MAGLSNLGDQRAAPFGKDGKPKADKEHHGKDDKANGDVRKLPPQVPGVQNRVTTPKEARPYHDVEPRRVGDSTDVRVDRTAHVVDQEKERAEPKNIGHAVTLPGKERAKEPKNIGHVLPGKRTEEPKNANAAINAPYADQRGVGKDFRSAGRASDQAEARGFESFNRSNAARAKTSYAAELGQALAQHATDIS